MDQENLYLKLRPNLEAFLRPKEKESMPELSRFYGISIYINWQDHNPPHIHFIYQAVDYSIEIESREILGKVPKRIARKMNKWMDEHKQEIIDAWEDAQKGKKHNKIEPLE